MGFVSFNEKYYRSELEKLESKTLTGEDVYHAQQLLKVLDDLADEGYTSLNSHMETGFSCLSRLRAIIRKAGASPFPVQHADLTGSEYCQEEFELTGLLDRLVADAGASRENGHHPFLTRIRSYCEWIGHESDTAYIFLLRDALLPYAYFRSRRRDHIYPWLISRRFLEDVTSTKNFDDEIRLSIYEALESGCDSHPEFCAFCRDRIRKALEPHPELSRILRRLLDSIQQENILVVETGYAGTIPMLLKALDDRVSFRLYATAPYLFHVYAEQIFCRRYEDIRSFETVCCGDVLLRYASYGDSRFFVNLSSDQTVRRRSRDEIRQVTPPGAGSGFDAGGRFLELRPLKTWLCRGKD